MTKPIDILSHNRAAWAQQVTEGNRWTIPVGPAEIAAARQGEFCLLLTPQKAVPRAWLGELTGQKVLGLASAGGQQGPIFAALGAEITIFDNCPQQLARDARVAAREGLTIHLEQGDMRDLSRFAAESFDLIFHPVSNVFIDDIQPVWRECYRVLKPGGRLLAGITNPLVYIFDFTIWDAEQRLVPRYRIPYSDLDQLREEELAQKLANQETLEFGHSLEQQIGGQLAAGFWLQGFYEDYGGSADHLLDAHIPSFIATLAVKPG